MSGRKESLELDRPSLRGLANDLGELASFMRATRLPGRPRPLRAVGRGLAMFVFLTIVGVLLSHP